MTLPTTPSQTVGPFYSIGLCRRADNAPGDDVELIGSVYDGGGEPIGDAVVEVWDPVGRQWARSGTDAAGRFSFRLSKPRGEGDDAPRLDAYVFARGLLKHQLTRIYFA